MHIVLDMCVMQTTNHPVAAQAQTVAGQTSPPGVTAEFVVALGTIARQLKMRVAGARVDKAAVILLHFVAAGAQRVSDLAGCIGLDHSTVSRHVKSLEDAGYVVRSEDFADRRAFRLDITDEGRRLLDEVLQARVAVMSEAMAGFSEDERRALIDLTIRLAAALDRRAADEEIS